jgi:hypothetical protein
MSGVFLDKLLVENVKKRFYKMETLIEFVSLLNYIEIRTSSNKKTIKPLKVEYLYYLSKTKNNRYSEFSIPKKSGKLRTINSPDKLIKRVQSIINILTQIIFEPYSHYCSNGFLYGKDIKRNALPHIKKNYVLNIDLKDFFPSINFRRIKVVLELSPFKLIGERERIGFLIANLSTYENYLPQGAPTSPLMSNIVTQKLDRRISKFCIKEKVKYSRYADDLTFSSNKPLFSEEFISDITSIIEEENFEVNQSKTRVRTHMQRQEVTGLIVNEKVNVKRDYLQKVRAMLNNWDKGGINYAESKFKTFQANNKISYDFREVLLGHLSFLKLIKGDNNLVIRKLRHKYNFLNNLIDYTFIDNNNVRVVLEKDNIKMEKIYLDEEIDSKEKFISFCTAAFHQIENLINYYYWKKFENFDDLLNNILLNNASFKKRYKNLENAKKHCKKISTLNINVLAYLYEKEFFFDKDLSYDKHITMLREVRNDDSHRCSIIDVDKELIIKKHRIIIQEESDKIKNGKLFVPTKEQQRIILDYKTLIFLEQKKYKKIRTNLRDITINIKNSLPKNFIHSSQESTVVTVITEPAPQLSEVIN